MTYAPGEQITGHYQVLPPPPRRSRAVMVGIIVSVVVFLLLVGAAIGYGLWLRSAPTQEDAQRECRTAVEREFQARTERATPSKDILVTVSDIDINETAETDNGFDVNYTVHYLATAPLVGSVPNTLSLTCKATIDRGKLTTRVVNRS